MDENVPQEKSESQNPKGQPSEEAESNLPLTEQSIHTGGGAAVLGPVSIQDGDFVGRDKIVITEEASYDVRGLPSPYLGLSAFTYADQASFGGRDQAVREAAGWLTAPGAQQTVLFITGTSGSGKSSFAQAGLLPNLEAYYQERRRRVARAVFRPSSNTLAMLADALSLLGLPELTSQELERFTPAEFTRFLGENTPKDQVNLLVIDQFEEFFSQSAPGQRDQVFAFLAGLPDFSQIRTHIFATLRSDFLDELFNYKELWNIAKGGMELRAMNQGELEEAIQKPLFAVCKGKDAGTGPDNRYCQKRFDPALLERLAQDASQDAAYLPLLQVTLQEIWKQGSLTLGEYGSLADSVQQRAEVVYHYEDYSAGHPRETRPAEDQAAITDIFLDLVDVTLDDDARRDVRRRRSKEELIGGSTRRQKLVAALIQARLLSAATEAAAEGHLETVDIIHESLINNWKRLKEAIAEQRQALQCRARFEGLLDEWLDHDRPDEYALTGVRLAEARELERAGDIALRRAEAQAYLRRSNDLAEAAQRRELERERARAEAERARAESESRRVRAARIALAGVSLLLLLALLAGGIAAWQRSQARREARISLARQLAAQTRELLLTEPKMLARAGLLSIESLRLSPESAGNQALGEALQVMPEPLARLTYDSWVSSVAFSPDGQWVVSGSDDGTARVWEAASGQEVARLTHDDQVRVVAFSPDGGPNGGWVASGSSDGTARVWEAASGQEVARMTHGVQVRALVFSPDGRTVVSGGCDQRDTSGACVQSTARVWEAASGREIARMSHENTVIAVAFSPDGGRVVSGGDDGTARVWEAASGREIARMRHDGWVGSVAFSPDGQWVVSGSGDGTARVWEAASGREIARMRHNSRVWSVAFSPDGQWVASGSGDGTARVWEAAGGREVARLAHDYLVRTVAFSPDGRWVVSGSDDWTARVWEAASGQEVARLTHDDYVFAVAFSRDGGPNGLRVATGGGDRTARAWEITNGREIARVRHDGWVNSVAFSPDGQWIASGSGDHTARVWEAANRKEIARMAHPDSVRAVAFSPDGQRVASGSDEGSVLVWEVANQREVARVTHGNRVRSVAFSPDGQWVVSGSEDGSALVWEADTGREVTRMIHESRVWAVAFSPDGGPNGQRVASGDEDGIIRLWEVLSRKEVVRIAHGSRVRTIAFSPDGQRVASGGEDGIIRVWAVASGREVARMTHDSWVNTVAFSADGQWIVSAGGDNTLRAWEAASGRDIARITQSQDVSAAAFSPDGQWIVSGAGDETVRVWLWPSEDLIELACTRLERNLTQAEWKQYLPNEPYRRTCPDLPPGE